VTTDQQPTDAALAEAATRMRREREAAEARIRALESILARRTILATRLEATIADARAERRAIDTELATVLSGTPGSAGS